MTYKGIGECRAITLTDAVGENLVGTSGNDTFKGVLTAGIADGTYQIGDNLDGAAGRDTLTLTLAQGTATAATVMAFPAGASIANIEVVNLVHTDNVAFKTLSSSSFSGVEELWQVDNSAAGAGTFQGVTVAETVIAGFKSTGATATAVAASVTVTAATTTQKSITVALSGVDDASSITAANAAGGSLKTLTVNGSVTTNTTGSNTLTVVTAGTETLVNLGLTSNTTVTVTEGAAGTVKTIDLTKSTGNITLDTATVPMTALASVIGGSGNDTLTVDLESGVAKMSVNGGAGADNVILVGSGGSTDDLASVTLGAGKDTLTPTTVTNILAATPDNTNLLDNIITVTDFKTSEDTLDLSTANGIGGVALTSGQLTTVATGAATLFAAANAVAAIINAKAAGGAAVFNYGTDAYVFIDAVADGAVGTGDGLVKLVGVDASEFTNIQNGNLVL